jgi:SAM-dependent methyltransferase
MNPVHHTNRRAWDERAQRRAWHTEPAAERDFLDPLAAVDDCGWLGGNVRGRRVLCLAAGGGKHGPLLAAAGAEVTVVDLSPALLEQDRRVGAERGLTLRTVEASMDDLSMLPRAGFEIVIQPVSTCYAPDLAAVYREVARVTAPGALYISQHKQPASLQAEVPPSARGYMLTEPYYRSGPLPPVMDGLQHREGGTVEFLHRWSELIGGLCRAGFVIEDLVEPRHEDPLAEPGTFGHRCRFLPPFVTVKARRVADHGSETPKIWTP